LSGLKETSIELCYKPKQVLCRNLKKKKSKMVARNFLKLHLIIRGRLFPQRCSWKLVFWNRTPCKKTTNYPRCGWA